MYRIQQEPSDGEKLFLPGRQVIVHGRTEDYIPLAQLLQQVVRTLSNVHFGEGGQGQVLTVIEVK